MVTRTQWGDHGVDEFEPRLGRAFPLGGDLRRHFGRVLDDGKGQRDADLRGGEPDPDARQVPRSGGSFNGAKPKLRMPSRRPLHSTALGKVPLAWDPEGRADLSALGPLRAMTGPTIVDHGELRAELDRVREAGYALNDGESGDGIRTVAVPVLDRLDHVRYAPAVRFT
ncbi:IclR family transcriptional regulator domain-containing protein [Spongiactinospora gelatinilytica]|uniref:IclR family transcriptional regulator domain-containing protein n=1 Tax=Spongiactinospora gelatinilytica TaxID=2666298 RepID=UPI001F26D272|nr:IclR family transcriptional regulator C-terminal domain-containing protein [Spongiactinospora gelatinilytica]